jgi:hypothetical protein
VACVADGDVHNELSCRMEIQLRIRWYATACQGYHVRSCTLLLVLTFVSVWNTGLVACGGNSKLVGHPGKFLGKLCVRFFCGFKGTSFIYPLKEATPRASGMPAPIRIQMILGCLVKAPRGSVQGSLSASPRSSPRASPALQGPSPHAVHTHTS